MYQPTCWIVWHKRCVSPDRNVPICLKWPDDTIRKAPTQADALKAIADLVAIFETLGP